MAAERPSGYYKRPFDMGMDSRTALFGRIFLAGLMMADACVLSYGIMLKTGAIDSVWAGAAARAPETTSLIVQALIDHVWLLLLVCATTIAALAVFVRKPGRVLAAVVALIAMGCLVETNGLVFQDYNRNFFLPGAMLMAWILGLLFARLLGYKSPRQAELFGALGATAMIGAVYFNAGLSKIVFSQGELGVWINPAVIRLTCIMENAPQSSGQLWRWVAESPTIAADLAVATVLMELGGIFYAFGVRLRMFAAACCLGVHIGFLVLLHIIFTENVLLIIAFGFPWMRWFGGAVPAEHEDVEAVPLRRAHTVAVVVLTLLITIWVIPGGLATTIGGKAGRPTAAVAGLDATRATGAFGPLALEASVGDGWVVHEIAVEQDHAAVILARGEVDRVKLLVGGPDGPLLSGPFHSWPVSLVYREATVPFDDFDAAARDVARRLKEAGGQDDFAAAFKGWLSDAGGGHDG